MSLKNINVNNSQVTGVDDDPNIGSDNLAKSNGIFTLVVKNEKIVLSALVGKNKFNKDSVNLIKGKYVAAQDGTVQPNVDWCYLPIYGLIPGSQYIISGADSETLHVAFFNNTSFISGSVTRNSFTVPANCNIVTVSCPILKIDTLQVEEGREVTTYEEYQIINNQEIKTTNIGYWVNGESHEDANFGYVQLDLKRGDILVVNTAAYNYDVFTKVNSDGTKSTLLAASGTVYGSKEYTHYSFEDETIIVSISYDPARKRGSIQLINNGLVEGSGLQLIEHDVPLYGNRNLNYQNAGAGQIVEGHSFVTDAIPCQIGDIFAYYGSAYVQSTYCIYDENNTPIDYDYVYNTTRINYVKIIKDSRAKYIRFCTNVIHDYTHVVKLEKSSVIVNTDDYLNSQRIKGLKRYEFAITNEGINDNGEIAQLTGFYRSFAIPCVNGDKFIYRGRAYTTCAYAIYNASGTLLYRYRFYNQDNIVLTQTIEITQCDSSNCYIVFSTNILSDSYIYKYVDRNIAEMLHELEGLTKQNFELLEGTKIHTDGSVHQIVFSDGDLGQAWTTKPIPCKIGDQFFYSGVAYDSAYYAVYDSSDNVLQVEYHGTSAIPTDENGVSIPEKKYVTILNPNAAYVRFCSLGIARIRHNDPHDVSRLSVYNYYVYKYVPENQKYKSIKERTFIVDANGGGDYDTLWGAIVGTKGLDTKENPIIIKVMPGTYINDMREGIGEPYCNHRYMSIVGEDKVNCIIKSRNPYYNYMALSTDNSCLRLGSGSVYVANLTLISTSEHPLNPNEYYPSHVTDFGYTAYTIHLDCGAPDTEDNVIEIHNCRLYNDHGACFGMGIGPHQTVVISNCDMESNIQYETGLEDDDFVHAVIAVHDHSVAGGNTPETIDTHLIVKDCIMRTNRTRVVRAKIVYNIYQDLTFINNTIINDGQSPALSRDSRYLLTSASHGNNNDEFNYQQV